MTILFQDDEYTSAGGPFPRAFHLRTNVAALPGKVVTRSGQPAREILKIEKEEDVSGIVMGSHDSGGLEKLFVSSVAEAVVNRSKRPVLVVKH